MFFSAESFLNVLLFKPLVATLLTFLRPEVYSVHKIVNDLYLSNGSLTFMWAVSSFVGASLFNMKFKGPHSLQDCDGEMPQPSNRGCSNFLLDGLSLVAFLTIPVTLAADTWIRCVHSIRKVDLIHDQQWAGG